ncbi:MAG TPA: nitroreductase [Stellaceae bacterium]|nr:nitroreductase [Stellaceae bacterium]
MDAIDALMNRVSPAQLVEPGPDAAQLRTLLAAAARAPDHGRMQPWRFVLIEGEARVRFGEVMAQSLKRREPDAPAGKLDAERKKPLRAPLVVVVAAAVKENPKVPDVEQVVAAGAAAQNMLVAAHALGLGGFWRTGAAAYDPEVKRALGLGDSDAIVGFLYVGSVGVPGQVKPSDLAAVTRRW